MGNPAQLVADLALEPGRQPIANQPWKDKTDGWFRDRERVFNREPGGSPWTRVMTLARRARNNIDETFPESMPCPSHPHANSSVTKRQLNLIERSMQSARQLL